MLGKFFLSLMILVSVAGLCADNSDPFTLDWFKKKFPNESEGIKSVGFRSDGLTFQIFFHAGDQEKAQCLAKALSFCDAKYWKATNEVEIISNKKEILLLGTESSPELIEAMQKPRYLDTTLKPDIYKIFSNLARDKSAVDFSGGELLPSDIIQILSLAPHEITKLNLSNCHLRLEGLEELLRLLPSTKIIFLNIENNFYGREGSEEIEAFIATNPNFHITYDGFSIEKISWDYQYTPECFEEHYRYTHSRDSKACEDYYEWLGRQEERYDLIMKARKKVEEQGMVAKPIYKHVIKKSFEK